MIMKDKIIIIVLIYFIYVAVYKERQSLGCEDTNPFNILNPPCDNADNQYSRIIRKEIPQNPFSVFNRIVLWRKSFLLSIIIVTMYHLLIEAQFNGVKPLESARSTSIGSARSPDIEDSTSIYASSTFPWIQHRSNEV